MNDALPILLFGGPVEFAFSVANSWKLAGQKAKVTQSAGREVKRIAGLKALDFYRHYLGEHAGPAMEFPLAVYEPGQERFYLRAPVHYDDRSGAVSFSEVISFRYVTGMLYPMQNGLHTLKGGANLYTSRGTGTWGPPVRVLAPPEVTVIDLVRSPGSREPVPE